MWSCFSLCPLPLSAFWRQREYSVHFCDSQIPAHCLAQRAFIAHLLGGRRKEWRKHRWHPTVALGISACKISFCIGISNWKLGFCLDYFDWYIIMIWTNRRKLFAWYSFHLPRSMDNYYLEQTYLLITNCSGVVDIVFIWNKIVKYIFIEHHT